MNLSSSTSETLPSGSALSRARIHLGSALSCVDILVAAYWGALRIDPADLLNGLHGISRFSNNFNSPLFFQGFLQFSSDHGRVIRYKNC